MSDPESWIGPEQLPPKRRRRLVAWPVAVGNHTKGYRGVIRVGERSDAPWLDATDVWTCDHHHPTTEAARDCAWARIERA